MSKIEIESLYVDMDDATKYLTERTGCSTEQVELFFDGETEYLRNLGLIADEDELSEEELLAEKSTSNTVVDEKELKSYITKYTGLERSLVDKLDECWCHYLAKNGIMS